jgi:hypothetical protein
MPRQVLGFRAKILGFHAETANSPKVDIVAASLAARAAGPRYGVSGTSPSPDPSDPSPDASGP